MKKAGTVAVVKQIICELSSTAKAKTLLLAGLVKSKTSAIRARIIIFSLLRNKRFVMSSSSNISHKLHALLGQRRQNCCADTYVDGHDKSSSTSSSSVVILNNIDDHVILSHSGHQLPISNSTSIVHDDDDDDDDDAEKYSRLFDSDPDMDHLQDPGRSASSVIDIVKNPKQDAGQPLSLEDDIDHIADLFIRRFHRQIRIQI